MNKTPRNVGRRQGYCRHLSGLIARAVARNVERNEQRLVDILRQFLEHSLNRPPWFIDAQLGTLVQDREGIDVVITSDVGPLFLQVKSSDIFKRKFESEHTRRRRSGQRTAIIEVVIVNDRLTDDQVLRAALSALRCLYREVTVHGSFLPAKPKKPR